MKNTRLWILVSLAAILLIVVLSGITNMGDESETELQNASLDLKASLPGDAASSDAKDKPALVDNPIASIKRSNLRNTVERPLFSPSREAEPKKKVVIVKPKKKVVKRKTQKSTPPPSSQYTLLGVILGKDKKFALLRKKNDKKNIRIASGDNLGKWDVVSISSGSVELRKDGQSSEIKLEKPKLR